MTRLALVLCGFLIYFIQAQLLPAIFHTNWLPNLILTIIVMVTLFKGRYMGLMAAVIGGIVHDVLISNFFGLHLFPYVLVVYLLSAVKHRLYEERWYWSSAIVAICTLLDGFIRSLMILA
ncbi:rod shape-determining protein MreD, partial [uncultured Veillonella sp.]